MKEDPLSPDRVLALFRSGLDTERIAEHLLVRECEVVRKLREGLERDRAMRVAVQALREKGWGPAFSLEPQEKPWPFASR